MFWMMFMQHRKSIYFSELNLSKWLSIAGLVLVISGCDNPSAKKVEAKAEQPDFQMQAHPQAQVSQLQYQIQLLDVSIDACRDKLCPDIKIHRLESNFPSLDEAVDHYIYSYMSGFLQGFDLPSSTTEVNRTEKSQSQTPVKEIQQNKSQDNTTSDHDLSKKLPKDILIAQIKPQIDKLIGLADEVRSLGSSAQLNIYMKPQILNPDSSVITVVINANNYIGGAHGSSSQQYINFEPSTEKVLNIEQVIRAGKRKALNDLVYVKFQEWVKQSQPDMQIELYEKLWNFKLSENFYLSPQGMIFQYGEYEIGPYVVGLPRLIVAYNELNDILKAQYLPVIQKSSKELVTEEKAKP